MLNLNHSVPKKIQRKAITIVAPKRHVHNTYCNRNLWLIFKALDHIELIWKDINIVYQPEKKSRDTPKTIIHPNSGKVSSGEFLALMGATGFRQKKN